jgi:ATP-dependent DNA ligase
VYEPDRRSWRKVKHTRTADCVVGGYRLHKRGEDLVGSLLLGLYTAEGELAMAGVIGAFPMQRRRELFAELQPLVTLRTRTAAPCRYPACTATGLWGTGSPTGRRAGAVKRPSPRPIGTWSGRPAGWL